MGQYRISRNLEASFIDYLKPLLLADWSSDRVEKSFAKIYTIELPSLCIRVGVTVHDKVEIGSNLTVRTPQVLIDIFATSDGQRLDIKDWLIKEIKKGIIYYEYVIVNGEIQSKTANGRITVLSIDDVPIDFDTPKNETDVHDRYRHLITLSVSLGKSEE